MVAETMASRLVRPDGRSFLPASPRARRAARERGVEIGLVTGTGPGGRVVEADVLRHLAESPLAAVPAVAEAESPRATPVARKLAADTGVDLALVAGTGPGGRITREDVLAAASLAPAPPAAPMKPIAEKRPEVPVPVGAAVLEAGLTGRLVPLNRVRRVTAQKMALSAHSVARITLALEADMSEAIRMRQELTATYEAQQGLKLSYNDLLVTVVARALREHPGLNARWSEEGVILIDQVNLGLAMAVPEGLVVPVIRDADRKPLAEIARATADLVAGAREGKLSLAEITGGTFTITNLGMYGIEFFTPIVNPPEAAILGVGKIVEKPVVVEGQIVARPRMALCLSADHRVVDGAPAAQFLARVQQLLEKPYLLL